MENKKNLPWLKEFHSKDGSQTKQVIFLILHNFFLELEIELYRLYKTIFLNLKT